jgi:hypothetical protein
MTKYAKAADVKLADFLDFMSVAALERHKRNANASLATAYLKTYRDSIVLKTIVNDRRNLRNLLSRQTNELMTEDTPANPFNRQTSDSRGLRNLLRRQRSASLMSDRRGAKNVFGRMLGNQSSEAGLSRRRSLRNIFSREKLEI